MKILITEDKRKQLAYRILDDKLSELSRKDFDLDGHQQVLFIDGDGDIVMRWSKRHNNLYVSERFISSIRLFSFEDIEENMLVSWWVKNRLNIEPDAVYFVSPGSLDWEGMGLAGMMGEF
jgi:hypothetical protein